MKIGIIGPPQSGKTTIFKILLQDANISSDIGIFKVMDQRLEKLSEVFSSKKKTYPEWTFLDMGVLSAFTSKDYSKLQDIDLFICVAGAFFSENPKKDLEGHITDIILSDLEAIQNRISRIEKERMKIKTDVEGELKLLKKCQDFLSEGKLLYKIGLTKDEKKLFSGFEFITLKSMLVAINIQEETEEDKIKELEQYCSSMGLSYIRFFGKTESEFLELDKIEQEQFSKELGGSYNLRENMSRLISKELNLIIFFTAGEKETRGWHLEKGLPIIEAAGKIHSDIKRGFIRAEVFNYEDFIKCEANAHKVREAGLLKIEGKEYVVKDGDIINIRFNI